MTPEALALCADALTLALWLAAPVAVAAALGGLLAGFVQGLFALADPAIAQLARGAGVVVAWALVGPRALERVLELAQRAWGAL